ncbi:MAG TPA: NfeD family protein [Dehalococcoidales bacterium]|nr:NfeD family protein [Dehalococcoidales bacterium]
MTRKNEPSDMKTWLIVCIALLDDVAVLILVFVVLWFFDIKISLPVMIIIGLVFGTFVFIVHRAIVPSLRRKKVTGAEGMVGLTGEVTQSLKPKGVVRIKGEYWKARSVEGEIDVGEDVEVLAINGLNLEVRRKES